MRAAISIGEHGTRKNARVPRRRRTEGSAEAVSGESGAAAWAKTSAFPECTMALSPTRVTFSTHGARLDTRGVPGGAAFRSATVSTSPCRSGPQHGIRAIVRTCVHSVTPFPRSPQRQTCTRRKRTTCSHKRTVWINYSLRSQWTILPNDRKTAARRPRQTRTATEDAGAQAGPNCRSDLSLEASRTPDGR